MQRKYLKFSAFFAILCFVTPLANAQTVKITGQVKNASGYSVYLLYKDGSSTVAALPSSGKFTFSKVKKSKLSGTSLHLVSDEGRYFGPIVLQNKKSKVATTFSGKLGKRQTTLALGKITLKESYGSITSAATKSAGTALGKATVKAVNGKPVGAGEQGLVRTASAAGLAARSSDQKRLAASVAGADSDLDGLPDAFDADDDGGLILDASDSDSSGGDVPYTSMVLDFRKTINASVRSGLTNSAIDAIISGENVFSLTTFLSLPSDIASSVTGGHVVCDDSLVYCRPNTPTAYYGGISESGSEFRDRLWSTLLNSDGYPRLERITLSGGFPVMVASIQPRVGRDQFRPGDVLRTVPTGASGTISPRTFTLAPYFSSVPALQSYDTGSGPVTVDYGSVTSDSGSIPGVSSSNPIVLGADGLLTMTFWRPQRPALRSDESGYYDWGHLNYGVAVNDAQATCAGLFTNVSSDLVADSTPFGTGDSVLFNQGANGNPYRDSQDDRAASSSNTLSFTVDLKTCLARAGGTPTGTVFVRLGVAGESVTGGESSASQLFYVQFQ